MAQGFLQVTSGPFATWIPIGSLHWVELPSATGVSFDLSKSSLEIGMCVTVCYKRTVFPYQEVLWSLFPRGWGAKGHTRNGDRDTLFVLCQSPYHPVAKVLVLNSPALDCECSKEGNLPPASQDHPPEPGTWEVPIK